MKHYKKKLYKSGAIYGLILIIGSLLFLAVSFYIWPDIMNVGKMNIAEILRITVLPLLVIFATFNAMQNFWYLEIDDNSFHMQNYFYSAKSFRVDYKNVKRLVFCSELMYPPIMEIVTFDNKYKSQKYMLTLVSNDDVWNFISDLNHCNIEIDTSLLRTKRE